MGPLLALLFLLSMIASIASGFCPSNGNTRVLYVTTNNGDNVLAYDSAGEYLGPALNLESFPADAEVHKLRSMHFGPNGLLYLSSAKAQYSRIFAVSGNGIMNGTLKENCTRDYEFTVVEQTPENPFLDHPYDFDFHPETGALFVGNQNSVTVTKYEMKNYTHNSTHPTWTPGSNNKNALGNAVDDRGSKVTVPSTSGLFASSWSSSYLLTSVRGIALSPLLPRALVNGTAGPGLFTRDELTMGYYLLVCDVAADMVHVFDADTGEHLYALDVPSPIQVRFPAYLYSTANSVFDTAGNQIMKVDTPYVYVTSKENGMSYFVHLSPRATPGASAYPLSTSAKSHNRRTYSITRPSAYHSASGIVEHPTLNILLVADRNGRRIDSYASPLAMDFMTTKGPAPMISTLVKQIPDQPEFLMYALLENQANIPFCYELNPKGSLRYAALCSAGRLWFFFFSAIAMFVAIMVLYAAFKKLSKPRSRRMAPKAMSMESIPLLAGSHFSYGSDKRKN